MSWLSCKSQPELAGTAGGAEEAIGTAFVTNHATNHKVVLVENYWNAIKNQFRVQINIQIDGPVDMKRKWNQPLHPVNNKEIFIQYP